MCRVINNTLVLYRQTSGVPGYMCKTRYFNCPETAENVVFKVGLANITGVVI